MPPQTVSSQEVLELRQLELRVMAEELAVLAAQIRLADQTNRAIQDAQRREWELQFDQQSRHGWWVLAQVTAGAAAGIALGALFLNLTRPRSRDA